MVAQTVNDFIMYLNDKSIFKVFSTVEFLFYFVKKEITGSMLLKRGTYSKNGKKVEVETKQSSLF